MPLLPLDDSSGPLPGPVAIAPVSPVGPAVGSPSPFAAPPGSRLLQRAAVLLPVALIGVWAVVDWPGVRDGATRLFAADPRWLLLGVLFTCLGWVVAACVRQGAVPDRLPPGLLLASQVAAGAANHVLPAGVGAHAVTLRFLRRQGVPLARGTASIALYSLVRPLAKIPVLVVLVLTVPGALEFGELVPDGDSLFLVTGGLLLALTTALLLVTTVRSLRGPVLAFLRTALCDARAVHTRPCRVLALWGGAALAPVLQGCVIASVGTALGLPLPWAQVLLAFLVAGTAAGAVPAPGGIGPVDAALVFAMTALGAPLGLATTTVIGYRVLTVWLPLVPGVLVLSALVQREAL
ncbi:lysylphosphatidylglycerol synthase domain-containing protein [Streptomyces sp. NPDC008150]|uniref:lysylphosphatidylglycerol synthase transmembrane domain-containing protein n=1 Tax=Streptomyces sp. NPDC008150 TaxID=3364816 RepID=UPI0036E0437D